MFERVQRSKTAKKLMEDLPRLEARDKQVLSRGWLFLFFPDISYGYIPPPDVSHCDINTPSPHDNKVKVRHDSWLDAVDLVCCPAEVQLQAV